MPRIAIKHPCTFKGGRFYPDNEDVFRKDCLSLEGKQGYVTLKPIVRAKSNQQNRYYWGVVIPLLGEYFGYGREQTHSALCLEHLIVKNENGVPPYIKSTRLSEWATGEWERYMEYIRRWAIQNHGVYIPTPNEVDYRQIPDVQFY